MIPIICIVGRSGSGKTTLLEKLVPELRRRGYRVGTVKHGVHSPATDQPGKDTYRHAQAGAEAVVLATPGRLTLFRSLEREWSLEEIATLMTDMNLIVAEGYKSGDKPKIEVLRGDGGELLCRPEDGLIAVATDQAEPVGTVPNFLLDDVAQLADFIEERFLRTFVTPPSR